MLQSLFKKQPGKSSSLIKAPLIKSLLEALDFGCNTQIALTNPNPMKTSSTTYSPGFTCKPFGFLLISFLLLMGWSAQAQVVKTSTTASNWSTVTWSPAGAPAAIDDAIIATNVTVNQNVTVTNLTINAGSTLTMSGAFTLTVTGALNVNGTLAGGAGTGLIAVTGNTILSGTGAINLAAGSFTSSGTTTLNGTSTITDNNNTGTNTFTGLLTVNTGTNFSTANNSAYVFSGGISNAGTFSKTGTGAVTMNNTITVGGTSAITIAGAVTMNGATTINNTATTTFSGAVTASSTLTLNSAGATNFSTTLASTGLVTLSGLGITTVTGTSTFTGGATTSTSTSTVLTGNVTVGSAQTLTNNGTVNIAGTLNGAAGTSIWVNAANSTLIYSNAAAPMATGTLTATASGNTVNYSTGAQTIKGTSYDILTLGGASVTKTLNGITSVATTLTIPATITLSNSTFALTVPTITVNGILSLGSGSFTASGVITNPGSITIGAGNFTASSTISNSGTFSDASATGTNIITGLFTNTGTFSTTNNPAFEFQGGITNNGTMTATGTGTYSFTTNAQTISGTNPITFGGGFTVTAPGSVIFAGAGAVTITGATTANGTITLNSGCSITHTGNVTIGNGITYNDNGNATIAGTMNGTNAGSTFLIGAGITFSYANATAPMVTGSVNASAAGTTFNYSGANQSISAGTYNNLVLSGSGTKTLVGNVTVLSALTVPATFTLANSTFSLTVPSITVNGTLTLGSGSFTSTGAITNTGTITISTGNFTASSTISNSGTFSDVNGPGTNIITGLFTNTGIFTTSNNPPFEFQGGITNNGTMTATGTGTYSFTTNAQTISGTNPITFGGGFTVTAPGSVIFAGAGNVTITGVTTVNGTITLNSGCSITHTGAVTIGNGITYNDNGNATIAGTLNGTNAGSTFLIGPGLTFSYSNATAPMAIGFVDASAAGTTFNYSGAAQNISAGTYNNLVLSGSGVKTLVGNVTVLSALTVPATFTLANSTFSLTVPSITVNGTLSLGAGSFTSNGAITNTGAITIGAGNFTASSTISNSGTFSDAAAAGTNIITGLFTNTGTFSNTNNPPFEFQGGITNNGTMTATGTGNYSFTTNAQTISGTNPITFGGGFTVTAPGSVIFAGAGAVTITGATTVNGTITLNSGCSITHTGNVTIGNGITYNDNGNATIAGTLNGTNAGSTFLIGPGLTFSYSNATAPMAIGFVDASAAGTTFNYSGAAQNISAGTYNNLVLSGSATKTLIGNITVNSAFIIPVGITFNSAGFDFTCNSTVSVLGTYNDNALAGTNTIVGLLTNTGTLNNSGNSPFELRNGLTNNGTFTPGTGAFLFSTNNQIISGTNAITFGGSVSIGDNVQLTNNSTLLTINGVLTGLSATAFFKAGTSSVLTYGNNTSPMSGGVLDATASPNTFVYSSTSGTQSIKETTYHHLSFTGGATHSVPNITVNGNFTRTTSPISSPNFTWTFETSNASTINLNGSGISLPNIVINKAGGSITFVPSAAAQSNTLLSLTVGAGSFILGNAFATTLTITENLSGLGTLDMSTIAGHVLNLGGQTNSIQTFLTPAGSGSATVNYTRVNDQTIFASVNYRNLGITGNGDKTLNGPVFVDGTLTMSANTGRIVLGSSNLKLKSTSTIVPTGLGFSGTKMIVTDGAGSLLKEASTVPQISGFIFPIGSNGNYNPFQITTLTGTVTPIGYVSVRAVPLQQPNVPYYNNSLIKYWDVQTANIAITSASISYLYVNNASEVIGSNALYVPRVWNGTSLVAPAGASGGATNPMTSVGTTFLAGQWTGVDPTIRTTLYSYQSGDWANLNTWTTDPSGSTLVTSIIPGAGDQVVILNGRTVTTAIARTVGSVFIESGATLDLGTTTGHNLGTVDGQGLLRLSSVNYPGGSFTPFVSSTGGTIEYYDLPAGANILPSLPATVNTYNNLIVSNSTASSYSLNQNSTIIINGNLSLLKSGSGTTTYNLGSAAGSFTTTVSKNVTIAPACTLGVSSYNAAHTLNIYGNLDVSGRIDLQNGAPYTVPVNGRATLNFFGSVTNTTATFNASSQADLYDVTTTKNEGFELLVSASPSSTVGFNGGGITIIPNSGILHLGPNITIPSLGNVGNYDLGGPGVLPVFWIDGANVTDGGVSGAIVPYGTMKITAGSLTCVNGQGAVVLRESGLLQIDGGTVQMKIFRTSTTAVTHRGSFVMTGGSLNITGNNGSESSFYASFTLPYPENVFQMSGGTITITRTVGGTITPRGGILIASNAQNYLVTGGKVIVNVSGNQFFDITSTAPFYDMDISKTVAGTGNVQLNPISWSYDGSAGNTAVVPAQPLRILNNLNFNTAIAVGFLGNNNNIEVGGNLTVNNITTLSTGTGLLVFNGNAAQTFTMSGIIGVPGLGGLTVSKGSATSLLIAGTITNIPFSGGLNLLSGTLADGGKGLLFGGNVINNSLHIGAGRIVLNGTSAQTISSNGTGAFQNLEIASTAGAIGSVQVSATNTLRVNGNITLSTDRKLSIGIYKLILTGTSQMLSTAGSFSINRFIQTDGFLSDGGIVKTFSNTTAVVFPFGTGTNYTPATIQFSSAPTTWGTLDVRPVTARQLYVTDPNTFIYHWKVRQTGFTGVPANSINLTFNYGNLTDNAAYIPAFYDYQAIAYTPINDVTKVDEVTNNIYFTGVSYFNGDFTAGIPAAFGVVVPYYSRANGSWNTPSTWSNNAILKHAGAASLTIPSSNSPVFIGDGTTYFHTVTVPSNNTVSGSLIVDAGSILDLGSTTGNNFGALPYSTAGGAGRIRISSATPTAEFPAGDFGIFFTVDGGTTEYYSGATAFTIPIISAAPTNMQIRSYRNLILNPSVSSSVTLPNRDLEVYENVTINGNAAGIAALNDVSSKALTIHGNLDITSGNFRFGSAFSQSALIEGNLTVSTNGTMSVLNAGSAAHSINLLGNLTNNGTVNLNQASDVNISFTGINSRSITGTNAAATTSLSQITINKGTSNAILVNVDVLGTLITPTNNWLNLVNGTFRLSKAATITLTDAAGADFIIPNTTSLSLNHISAVVNACMANDNASDFILAGKLEILNGTLNIGNTLSNNVHNDLEYSASDVPVILVQGTGVLNVNGQIRRSVSVLLGSLDYTQKNNSTVHVFGKNQEAASSFNLNRAKFEILNPGSQFTMQDNALLIIDRNGLASGTFGDFYLNPASFAVTGGEVRFGTSDTPPSATESTFLLNTTTPFWNLTVDGTTTNKTVRLATDGITVRSNLSILGGSVFDANGLNVSIAGDMTNMNSSAAAGVSLGGYRPGSLSQVTTINGSTAVQQLTGNTGNLTNFANLVIDNSFVGGSLNLQSNTAIRVNSNLSILTGNLNTAGNLATVLGNVINNRTHTSSGAGYLVMGGSSNQTISGNGSGVFGNLRMSNAAGIDLDNPITINGDLNFVAGLFYINNNQLTLGLTSTVTGTLNASSMIRMNGVVSDGGLKKLYPASAHDFTFPVGVTLKYTPARINVTSNGVAGSVTIKLGNIKHPATTDPADKELMYYWSTASTGFDASTLVNHTYNYINSDAINGVEANYRTGRYVNNVWTPQFGIAGTVNAAANTMTLTGVNYFNGDYTAGEQTEFDQLLVFYSRNATLGGNWNDVNSWSTDAILTHAGAAAATPPTFNSVVIAAGHTINATANNTSAPTAIIDGTLDLSNFIGNNLGTVTGTGTIRLAPTGLNQYIFPAGTFATFTSAGGGTIEYYNTSGTATLPSQGIYNHLVFSGASTKALFNTDIVVNGNLTINAGTVTNPSNRILSLKGNLINSSGLTALQTGTTGSLQLTGGVQSITGATSVGKLILNGAGFKTLNSSFTVTNQLTYTSGIIQTGANQLILALGALGTGASASSYVYGNLQKYISGGTVSRNFEVGDATTYAPVNFQFTGTTNSGGSITVSTASGDHPATATSGIDGSKSVNRNWSISNSGVGGFTAASVTFNFVSGDLDPAVNTGNLSAAKYTASSWTQQTVGTRTSTSLQITGLTSVSLGISNQFELAEPFAAGITWTGLVNVDWNNPGNWNPNTVPTGSDNITIPVVPNEPSFLTPGNGIARNIVLQTGAIVNIPAGYQITVNGNWISSNGTVTGPGNVLFTSPVAVHSGTTTFNGVVSVATGANLNTSNSLVMASGAAFMHGTGTTGGGGTVTGNLRIRRSGALNSTSYNFWSSPITNATLSVLSGNRYMYDPNSATGSDVNGLRAGWIAPGATMTPGRGYIATGTGNAAFIGTPNNGNISFGPMALGTYTNFNLIGNPYPCAISASAFVSANPQILGGAIYFWDDDNSAGSGYAASDYGVYNGIGFVGPNSGKTFNGNIASAQGFFIQASNTGSINFTNSMRTSQSSTFFETEMLERIWVSVTTANEDYNETLIAFKEDATDGNDPQYDATKLRGNADIAMYSKIGNEDFAIQALSQLTVDKTIQIGIEASSNGTQVFRLKQVENLPETAQIILEDRKLGIFHNLRNNPEYSYDYVASTDTLRFSLHFKPEVIMSASTESCVQNDGEIIINSPSSTPWTYHVTTQSGVNVSQGENFSGTTTVHNLAGGIYFISLNNQFGSTINQAIEVASGSPVVATASAITPMVELSNAEVSFTASIQGANESTWDFGDGTIVTGILNPVHVYTAAGSYTVTFIASNSTCMDVKTMVVTVRDLTTGMNSIGSTAFSMFPNPAVNSTTVSLRLPERQAELVFNILDASGKLVKSQTFKNVDATVSLTLNVLDLTPGVYQVLINGGTYSTSARLNVIR